MQVQVKEINTKFVYNPVTTLFECQHLNEDEKTELVMSFTYDRLGDLVSDDYYQQVRYCPDCGEVLENY